MKISAVIPAHNSAKFITEAIASIQKQTREVDEIIVVDDGSDDNTGQVVQALPGNIVYAYQTNQGPSAARNKGIELAKGDWIAFLDADDQWTAEKTAMQLRCLTENPSLHLIAGDMTEIDDENRILANSVLDKHHLLEQFRILDGKPVPDALSKLVKKNFIPTGTVLAKRSTLMEVGLFNDTIRYGEDLELWAKIAAKYPVACLPDILMLRRQHGNNATQASEKMLMDLTKVTESLGEKCASELKQQHINPKQMISESHWTLGYWYFVNGDQIKARKSFLTSLQAHWSSRSAIYLFVSYFSQNYVDILRRLKQKFN